MRERFTEIYIFVSVFLVIVMLYIIVSRTVLFSICFVNICLGPPPPLILFLLWQYSISLSLSLSLSFFPPLSDNLPTHHCVLIIPGVCGDASHTQQHCWSLFLLGWKGRSKCNRIQEGEVREKRVVDFLRLRYSEILRRRVSPLTNIVLVVFEVLVSQTPAIWGIQDRKGCWCRLANICVLQWCH